jgi:hypothetical protein
MWEWRGVTWRQFYPTSEDGGHREDAGDLARLSKSGAHRIYAPSLDQIYGENFSTTISLGGVAWNNTVN